MQRDFILFFYFDLDLKIRGHTLNLKVVLNILLKSKINISLCTYLFFIDHPLTAKLIMAVFLALGDDMLRNGHVKMDINLYFRSAK